MNKVKRIWNNLVGAPFDFSMEERTYHSASLIALLVLIAYSVVNFLLGLSNVFYLSAACLLIQLSCFTLSRYVRQFRIAIIGSALLSYAALILNYFINSGINGPTLFIFFFTFNLLIIVTPGKLRYTWIILHAITVAWLLTLEYFEPDLVRYSYSNPLWRSFDIYLTYLITLAFLYYVSIHLRNYYEYERKISEMRFTSLMETSRIVQSQETNIRERDKVLGKIAFIQSHELRAPVSSIMGLLSILREDNAQNSEECLMLLDRAVTELDDKIRQIVKQTEEIRPDT